MAKPKQGLIDVSKYPDDTEVPSFAGKAVCAKCGARGRHIDVRPNWKEQPPHESLTGKHGVNTMWKNRIEPFWQLHHPQAR
jgi:hypothetical protein